MYPPHGWTIVVKELNSEGDSPSLVLGLNLDYLLCTDKQEMPIFLTLGKSVAKKPQKH